MRNKVISVAVGAVIAALVFCFGLAFGKANTEKAAAVPVSYTQAENTFRFTVMEEGRTLKQSYEIIRDTKTGAEYLLFCDAGKGCGLCPLVK